MSRDPSPVGEEIDRLLRSRGWQQRLVAARVVARWPDVVGQAVASHCQPRRLEDDGTLLERLTAIIGAGIVRQVRVRTGDPNGYGRAAGRS